MLFFFWLSLQKSNDERYLPPNEIWLYAPDSNTWYVLISNCSVSSHYVDVQMASNDHAIVALGLLWVFCCILCLVIIS